MRKEDCREMFGRMLYRLRVDRGLSQGELAHKAGIQGCWISHFECGRRSPSLYIATALAVALDCKLDDFMPICGKSVGIERLFSSLDLALHEEHSAGSERAHRLIHIAAGLCSQNPQIVAFAEMELDDMVIPATSYVTALKKIREVTGSSTEAWHIADDALAGRRA